MVLLIVLNAVSTSTGKLAELGAGILGILAFAVGLHVVFAAMNYGISRLLRFDAPSTAAFVLHVSQKSLGLSFIVWSGFFAEFRMGMIFSIAYHAVQLILDTYLAHWFAGRTARVAEPTGNEGDDNG